MIALLFSLLIKLTSSHVKSIDFEVKAVKLPQDKILLNDSLNTIRLTLKTTGFKFLKFYFNKPYLNINFSKLLKNEKQYLWIANQQKLEISRQFDAKISVEQIEIDTLKIAYSTNQVKKVPVKLDKHFVFIPGYDLVDKLKVTPDSIKIIGPHAMVDTINFVTSKLLTIKNIDSDVNAMIGLKNKKKHIVYSTLDVNVSGRVKKITEGELLVPINVNNVPKNLDIKIYPKYVPVVFNCTLEVFKLVTKEGFLVECDYNDIDLNRNYLKPVIKRKPAVVKSAKLGLDRVEYILIK